MPLTPTLSLDVTLSVGAAMAFLGVIFSQFWWIFGGSLIFISSCMGAGAEEKRLEQEELAEGLRRG